MTHQGAALEATAVVVVMVVVDVTPMVVMMVVVRGRRHGGHGAGVEERLAGGRQGRRCSPGRRGRRRQVLGRGVQAAADALLALGLRRQVGKLLAHRVPAEQ